MLRFIVLLFGLLVFAPLAWAQNPSPIMVDQFGYLPELQKRAVIKNPQIGFDRFKAFNPSNRYAVIDTRTRKAVYEGAPVKWNGGKVDAASGDKVWWFDFSSVTTPGQYVVRDLERGIDSYPFEIGSNVYKPVLQAAFKTSYLQRAGFEKRAPYVDAAYADKASHLGEGQDPQARLYSSKEDRSAERDLRGGWYDAGDYNKYTSWTANYVTILLSAYLENPTIWTDDFGIPESGNGVSDILDEVKWGLDWLERMQNKDGSMLSVMGLSEGSPPSSATGPSLYGPANTSATVTSAGAFAMAAKVYGENTNWRSDAKRYADRAKKAWSWAEANPKVKFYNNDANQGSEGLAAGRQEVDARRLEKKRLIAGVHLYALTGERSYSRLVEQLYSRVKPMASGTVNGFEGQIAFEMLYFARQKGVAQRFTTKIKNDYQAKVLNAHNGWSAVSGQDDGYGAFTDGY